MKTINIKLKLGLLFIVLCISIGILGFKSIVISQDNKDRLSDVQKKTDVALNLQSSIITPLHNLRQLNQSLVMAANNEIRSDIKNDLDDIIQVLNKNFDSMNEINSQTQKMWKEYKKEIEQIQLYLNEEFEEGAYINITTISKKQFDILVNELLKLQEESLDNVRVAYNEAQEKAKEVKREVFISLFFILLFAIIIGWTITSNILKSIYAVQNGLNDFFRYLNDKTTKVSQIQIDSKDEFQQMATIINNNVAYTRNNIEQNEALIKNATKVLENIKGGNLGTRLTQDTNNKSLNELKNMINYMIDNLEEKIQSEINKRLEHEQMLIQQSKLAAMGEMIGNIAHQWRQPLAQISAIHMNMRITYDFHKFTKEYLIEKIDEANKLTAYMSQTINDFQNFFKPEGEKKMFSIKTAFEDAYHIIESSLKYHSISLEMDVIEDCEVLGYGNEFSQVILNILSNAKDIIIERETKNPKIKVTIKLGELYAVINIEDNAGGVPEDVIDKIFDPYFTTRHKTQGTGIGLYMTKNIIERNMHGFINVKNSDTGAIFTVKVLRN